MPAKPSARPAKSLAAKEPEALPTAAEREVLMKALRPLVDVLGDVIGRHVEVALHDLTRPEQSVVAIANGHISNRSVGSSILSGPKDDIAFQAAKRESLARGEAGHSVIHSYPTVTPAGRRLKSSTVVFRDRRGEPFAAFCMNADFSAFEAAHAWLESVLKPKLGESAPRAEEPGFEAQVDAVIAEAVRDFGKPVAAMGKSEKMAAVDKMSQRGLFVVRGGVDQAARALGVTRYTVYNYLNALRGKG